RKYGGLGLGLAIVRHLVEMHGGTVSAESGGHGRGATFTIQLPQAAPLLDLSHPDGNGSRVEQITTGSETLGASVKLKGQRVLLVDDEAATLGMLSALLRERGAEVKACTSAREAFDILQEWKPDVMISDIGMPEEDGYEFIRKVRALEHVRGGHTPAIALSGYARAEDRGQALAAGFQTHLAKPVEPSELTAAVAKLTERIPET
ncbi:MAG: response regulator, partial [Acidobacteria bacterium]|nr:response regulator [Acidobacteriota bacterium]